MLEGELEGLQNDALNGQADEDDYKRIHELLVKLRRREARQGHP
jgi:hypothetical protein